MKSKENIEIFIEKLNDNGFIEEFSNNPDMALKNINIDMTLDELFNQLSKDDTLYTEIIDRITDSMDMTALSAVVSSC